MSSNTSQIVTICNQRGLHARAASKFVRLAETFEADIVVNKAGTEVPGQSIMGLLMLAAGPGTDIEIRANGPAAAAAVAALVGLVESRFGEEE
ncbi:MAG: HPr family phosphocarrier protein [Pseudomonadota bacterium]